jgi:hypothetical protein
MSILAEATSSGRLEMSDDDSDPAAEGRQRASRAGMQPVTNTSPSGIPAAAGRPEIGLDSLNPTQMEAWLTLVEIVFGADGEES